MPDLRADGDANPLTELLATATERTVLAEAPGKSGATLERVVKEAEEIESWQLPLALRADLSARATEAAAEFDVLAALQTLVEPAHAIEDLAAPAGAINRVHPAWCAGARAEMRIPYSKGMC